MSLEKILVGKGIPWKRYSLQKVFTGKDIHWKGEGDSMHASVERYIVYVENYLSFLPKTQRIRYSIATYECTKEKIPKLAQDYSRHIFQTSQIHLNVLIIPHQIQ